MPAVRTSWPCASCSTTDGEGGKGQAQREVKIEVQPPSAHPRQAGTLGSLVLLLRELGLGTKRGAATRQLLHNGGAPQPRRLHRLNVLRRQLRSHRKERSHGQAGQPSRLHCPNVPRRHRERHHARALATMRLWRPRAEGPYHEGCTQQGGSSGSGAGGRGARLLVLLAAVQKLLVAPLGLDRRLGHPVVGRDTAGREAARSAWLLGRHGPAVGARWRPPPRRRRLTSRRSRATCRPLPG